jgi:hypothetical protein
MLALSSGLLRTGLALKIRQIKLATRSYLRDRAAQGQGIVASYAVAAGLYAAAGIFLIAACLVGVTALFRWIEMNYGLFQAFGAVGGLLLIVAIVFAALAASKLKRPAPHFPSLTSRLRAAIKANPVNPDQIEAVRDTAAAKFFQCKRLPKLVHNPACESAGQSQLKEFPLEERLLVTGVRDLTRLGEEAGWG